MKFIFLSIIVLAAFSTGFVSCDNGVYTATPDSVNNAPNPIYEPPAPSNHFTATINGTAFTANTSYYIDTIESNINIFEITGANNPTDPNNIKSIIISLPNYTGTGTYRLNDTATNATFAYIPQGLTSLETADSGVVVITSINDSVLSGTFQFVTDSGTNITKGVFTKLPKL